jgi:hypothetical protein
MGRGEKVWPEGRQVQRRWRCVALMVEALARRSYLGIAMIDLASRGADQTLVPRSKMFGQSRGIWGSQQSGG